MALCDLGKAPWVSVLVSLSSSPDLGTKEQIGRSILDCNVKTGAVNSRVGTGKPPLCSKHSQAASQGLTYDYWPLPLLWAFDGSSSPLWLYLSSSSKTLNPGMEEKDQCYPSHQGKSVLGNTVESVLVRYKQFF